MKAGTNLRIFATVFATPFLVVGYLNIEKLAESKGWDGLLTTQAAKMPESVASFVISPLMAMVSSLVVGVIIGIWADTFLRAADRRKSSLQVLGFQANKISQIIDQKADRWGSSQDDCIKEYSAAVMLLSKMRKQGLDIPSLNSDDMLDDAKRLSKYFKLMSPHMMDGDRGATKRFSKIILKD